MISKKKKDRRRKIRKRKNYKFSDKVHPVKGILSFCFAILAAGTLFVTSYISYRAKGAAGIGIGLAGFAAFLLSLAGVVLSILALQQKEIHYRFPVAGGILCGFLVAGYFFMYILGAVI